MNQQYAEQLVAEALAQGAVSAVAFHIGDIVFDRRTLLKCMFGCSDWGKGPTCPSRPGNVSLDEYEKMLKLYRWGVIIHAHDKKTTQSISLKLESKAFVDGYYFAFSMSDCALCKECAGLSGKPCVNVKQARPAFHSVGIDVFATARKFHLPINTLADETQEQNWYSAVFVE
jgi:predicted metal-binding protein